MHGTTRTSLVLLTGILLLGGLIVFPGIGATQASTCHPIDDRQVCISDFSVSADRFVVGETGELSLTVTNNGTGPVTGTITLHTAGPENETAAYTLDEITVDEGESTTVSREINATNPGIHGFRVTFVETETRHVFAVSAIKTIEVLEDHPKELGGPIDRTELALGALVGAVGALLLLGYRELNS